MKVNEIFYSIEGEGIRAGMPCTFIRLFGCNLNCSYCDTRYACEGDDFKYMSIAEILDEVKKIGCPNVTVTGGEPLMHDGIRSLLLSLAAEGYKVNVETNGTFIPEVGNVIYTIDFKTKSSGMSECMKLDAFKALDKDDVIKFVVGSQEDLGQALSFIGQNDIKAQVFVSPIFGKIELVDIANFLTEHKLHNWRMQLQMHKYIWNPETRGV